MGEEVGGVPEAAPVKPERRTDPSADAAETSIGRYLARQRQLRRISLDDLAALTKIPRRSLERLEAGAFDGSPDGFARGFVRAVAEALGLDPTEAVMRLMHEPDADEPGLGGRRWPRALPLAGIGLGAAAALLGVLLWKLLAGWLAPAQEPQIRDLVVREDPVRALAREEAERGKAPAAP
jgi:cytoskeleton protein RodZ